MKQVIISQVRSNINRITKKKDTTIIIDHKIMRKDTKKRVKFPFFLYKIKKKSSDIETIVE